MKVDMEKAAVQLAGTQKFALIPIHEPIPRIERCSCHLDEWNNQTHEHNNQCKRKGKHPYFNPQDLPNGRKNATRNIALIKRWWGRWPEANIEITTGKISDLLVIDLDGPEGEAQWAKFTTGLTLPITLEAISGSGIGRHIYYRLGPVTLPTNKLHPVWYNKVEIKAEGGGVIAPPSLHISGKRYEWKDASEAIAPVPPELLARIRQLMQLKEGEKKSSPWEVEIHGEGERNEEFTRKVGSLARSHIPLADLIVTAEALNIKYNDPPLEDEEIKTICESIWKRENKQEAEREQIKKELQPFVLYSFQEMLEMYGQDDMSWQITGWLPEATICLLSGLPESYKTWVGNHAAYCMATGEKFFGVFDTNITGPVIYMNQEDLMPTTMRRFARMWNNPAPEWDGDTYYVYSKPNPRIWFHKDRQFNFSDKETVRRLDRYIKKLKAKSVVIDPLNFCLDDADQYYMKSLKDLRVLKSMRDEHGCSFILVHHMNAGERKEGMRQRDRIWGNNLFRGFLETGIELEPTDTGIVNATRHTKDADREPDVTLQFKITDYGFKTDVIGETAVEKPASNGHGIKTDSNREKARVFLQQKSSEGATPAEIKDYLQCSSSSVSHYMALINANKKDGRYFPADDQAILLSDLD